MEVHILTTQLLYLEVGMKRYIKDMLIPSYALGQL